MNKRTIGGAVGLAVALGVGSAVRLDAQIIEQSVQAQAAVDRTPLEVTSFLVRVPETRAATSRGTIDLAVVRVRRPGAQPGRSAHVVLAGGPGDSGVSLVTGLVRQGGASIWELFDGDIIGIDQRGTGRSRPLLTTTALYQLPLDRPGSAEEWLPRVLAVNRAVADGFRKQGVHLEAYNTQESADDIDAVRRALGYERLTLWGRSYGTHLALATLARHPALVSRLVLISPEGPDHTWKLPSEVDAVLERLEDRGAPGLTANIRSVLSRLRESPVTVTITHPLTGADASVTLGAFDVQWLTADALGDPRLVATVPAAFEQMAAGRFESFAQVAAVRRSRAGVQSAMKQMMDLSSGASPERRERIEREAAGALLGNAINFPGMFLADAWAPVRDLGSPFRRPVQSSVPVLIVTGDLDPRTPVRNAREIAATLPAARVVVLENATHQFDLFGSPRLREVIVAFFRGEKVPDAISFPPLIRPRD